MVDQGDNGEVCSITVEKLVYQGKLILNPVLRKAVEASQSPIVDAQ
jgi:hypothetical protein